MANGFDDERPDFCERDERDGVGGVACAASWLEMVDARHGYAGTP